MIEQSLKHTVSHRFASERISQPAGLFPFFGNPVSSFTNLRGVGPNNPTRCRHVCECLFTSTNTFKSVRHLGCITRKMFEYFIFYWVWFSQWHVLTTGYSWQTMRWLKNGHCIRYPSVWPIIEVAPNKFLLMPNDQCLGKSRFHCSYGNKLTAG